MRDSSIVSAHDLKHAEQQLDLERFIAKRDTIALKVCTTSTGALLTQKK